jgi:hypothetical protein
VIADFTKDEYVNRMKEIVREQISMFEGFDYLFLEFEGIQPEDFARVYADWSVKNGKPDIGNLTYTDETRSYCKSIAQELNILWSEEGREMFRYYYGKNLQAVHDMLQDMGYKGDVGVVHHLYGYEALVYPDILPDKSWWLLPWHYWVFEKPGTPEAEVQSKKVISKALLKQWKDSGYKVCYIGDVTMGSSGLGHIEEFYRYSEAIELDGYLGMGNPDPEIGLRWNELEKVEAPDILASRELYRRLYGKT